MDGKSWGFLRVLRDHRAAVEYDWWTRFGRSLRCIGSEMSLSEASRLVEIIRADPSSALAAAAEGWDHPVSREAAVLMDLWDLEAVKSGAKRPPRYSRPWQSDGAAQKYGDVAGRTRAEVDDILARARSGQLNPV